MKVIDIHTEEMDSGFAVEIEFEDGTHECRHIGFDELDAFSYPQEMLMSGAKVDCAD